MRRCRSSSRCWRSSSTRASARAGLKLAGILVGLLGVGVLAGVHPEGGSWAVVGTLAVVLASFCYAGGGLYGQRALGRATGPVLATASMLYGGLLLLPFALFQLPDHAPGWKPVLSLLGIAVLGTAVAQLFLFRILRLFGAARLSLVTYLIPAFALLYGSLILDEPLRPSMLVGLGLILGGVALGSGRLAARCAAGAAESVARDSRRARAGRRRLRRRAARARRGRAVPLAAPRQGARGRARADRALAARARRGRRLRDRGRRGAPRG